MLIRLLADGRFHSGEALGERLGVSRAAVWKSLRTLSDLGIGIDAVAGRGYRMEPLELLDVPQIQQALSPQSRRLLRGLELLEEVGSTNQYMLQRAVAGQASGCVCLSERQSAGRGRRGRMWVSPFGRNIYLSVLWRFADGPGRLVGLSLVVSLAVIRALREAGVDETGVKWPNDVYWRGRKLAGILLEVAGESNGPCHVVVGVGLNHKMPARMATEIDQPWVDIEAIRPGISRNRLAGLLIHHLLLSLEQFAIDGLAPHRAEWDRLDVTAGQAVILKTGSGEIRGVARGIDCFGALRLERDGRVETFPSGEVSLRPAVGGS